MESKVSDKKRYKLRCLFWLNVGRLQEITNHCASCQSRDTELAVFCPLAHTIEIANEERPGVRVEYAHVT